MNFEEIEELAGLLAEKMEERHEGCCSLNNEELEAVRELLKTRRYAVKVFLFIFGAMALYAIKDIYLYTVGHMSFK